MVEIVFNHGVVQGSDYFIAISFSCMSPFGKGERLSSLGNLLREWLGSLVVLLGKRNVVGVMCLFLPFLGNITIFLGQHWLTFLEQHNQYSPIIFWLGNVFISEVLPK
jgi:hypothetical protein